MLSLADIIAQRVQSLCDSRGIKITTLATMSGLPHSTVDSLIHRKSQNPKLLTLIRIAHALNMQVSELLDFPEMNEFTPDDLLDDD